MRSYVLQRSDISCAHDKKTGSYILLAQSRCIARDASLEAEPSVANKHVPAMNLLVCRRVASCETSRVGESSQRIPQLVGTHWVQFASGIISS